jgi:hypothetical protein
MNCSERQFTTKTLLEFEDNGINKKQYLIIKTNRTIKYIKQLLWIH